MQYDIEPWKNSLKFQAEFLAGRVKNGILDKNKAFESLLCAVQIGWGTNSVRVSLIADFEKQTFLQFIKDFDVKINWTECETILLEKRRKDILDFLKNI